MLFTPNTEHCHARVVEGLLQMFTEDVEINERDIKAFLRKLEASLDALCEAAEERGIELA